MDQPTAAPLGERIRATFLAPRQLWDRLEGAVPWLDVLYISTIVAVLSVFAVPEEVFIDPMQDAVTRRGEPVEITSPPAEIVRWGRAMAMLATLATHPMIAFMVAGFLTLVFSVLGGGRGTYREYLSLSCHVLLIPALGTILAVLVRLITGIAGADPFALFDLESRGLLAATVLSIDPFVVWMLVVLGIATAQVDGKREPWRAVVVLLGAYLVLLVVTAGLATR
jgi:hypothetical protein